MAPRMIPRRPPPVRTLLCRFGWHWWSAVVQREIGDNRHDVWLVERRCVACGKREEWYRCEA